MNGKKRAFFFLLTIDIPPPPSLALSRSLFVERGLWEDDAAREECALCVRVRKPCRAPHG